MTCWHLHLLRLYFKKPSLSLSCCVFIMATSPLNPSCPALSWLPWQCRQFTYVLCSYFVSALLFPQHKEKATCPWKSVSEVLTTAATSSNVQYPSCLCSSQTHVVQKWFVSIDDVIFFFFLPEINSVFFSLAGISSVSLTMTPGVYYSSTQ